MGLFSEFRRRNVFRMAALYIVAAWLILQVAEVLVGLLNLPAWIGPAVLILLAVGFPIALVLSWFYEFTPQGIALDKEVEPGERSGRVHGRRLDIVVIALLAAAVLMFAYDKWSTVDHPVITEYRKLTHSRVLLPPVPSVLPLVVGESRIYFMDFSEGDYAIRQVLKTGGEATRFDLQGRDWTFLGVPTDITPDGGSLLLWGNELGNWVGDYLWTVPVIGGGLRQIDQGRVGVYSSDGFRIAFIKGDDRLFVANADLSDPRQIATLPGRGYALAFSPDGTRIRLSVFKGPFFMSLWEVPVEGGDPEQVLADWPMDSVCCGSWTPDGKYFVFEASDGIRSQIWAVRDVRGAEPFQLTRGAIQYVRPSLSEDGRTIFASGWQRRGEVVEYEPADGTFKPVPGLENMSVDQLEYSADGTRVAYIKYPELTMWHKGVASNDARQLTFDPMIAAGPRWSPDGRSIAFTGWTPGASWSAYVIRANGGEPRMISSPEVASWSPNWSPDGEKIMFSEAGRDRPTILDLLTNSTQTLAGEGKLDAPRWSPDGMHIAGRSGNRLIVHNMQTGQSKVLAAGKFYERWYWSADSRSLFVVDSVFWGSRRAVYKMSIEDGDVVRLWQIGRDSSPWGSDGRWIGVAPTGKILMLRNNSIHNIYALEWNP